MDQFLNSAISVGTDTHATIQTLIMCFKTVIFVLIIY